MRWYTNRNGDAIEVSQEHMNHALYIYDELKKMSPSGKVSWNKHKELMELDGFNDSDNCENYRSLIKRERYKRGTVPSIENYKSDVLDNKLSAVKSIIGEIKSAQLEARNDFNALNRAKREWNNNIILSEIIQNKIDSMDWSMFKQRDFKPICNQELPNKKAIVILSDLHFGYEGKTFYTSYNTEIVRGLLDSYAKKILYNVKLYNIDRVHVVNLGDLVEGILRGQSLFDTRKNLSQQAISATDLLIEFLLKLTPYVEVWYSGIAGNHDRLNPNKNDNIEGDSVMFISNTIIERVSRQIPKLTFMPLQNQYYGIIGICGKHVLVVHGDRTSVFKDSILAQQSQVFGIDLDILVAGHYHRYLVKEVSDDKYVVIFGSIKGVDEYSINIGKTSCRSQGMIIFDNDGSFEIKQIKI